MAQLTGNTEDLSSEVEKVKELINDIVSPQNRHHVNFVPDHVTVLRGIKSKKQFRSKKKNVKKTTLTRKEYAELGLYNLPTKSLKYDEFLPLHDLWLGYIKEHMDLENDDDDDNEIVPTLDDPKYDAFSKLLVKTDLHGAKISVIKSRCPNFIGQSGIIVLDTKNTFKIIGKDNKLRTIPKKECIFMIKVNKLVFTLFGKHLTIRPAERSVKKIKNFVDLEL